MNTTVTVVIVLAVVVLAAVAVLAVRAAAARRELKERYGPEYDRAIDEHGGRSAAEAELRRRERAHNELELKDLTPEEITRYRAVWIDLQGQFIDDPKAAVRAADQLVSKLVSDRGYPVVEFDDRVAQLSVEHAGVLNAYRDAHAVAVRSDSETATTEELRQAVVHYRELIADLLGDPTLDEPIVTAPAASTFDADSEPTDDEPTEDAVIEEAPIEEAPTSTSSAVPAPIPAPIPTVDGQPPTAADLSANEGYVAIDADPAVVPDDARDLAADDIAPVTASPTGAGRSKASDSEVSPSEVSPSEASPSEASASEASASEASASKASVSKASTTTDTE